MGKFIKKHEGKIRNLYAVLKDVFPEKWFDDARIQDCYHYESFAEFENRLRTSINPALDNPEWYSYWQTLPQVFWEIPIGAILRNGFASKAGSKGEIRGVDVINKLIANIDTKFTDWEILKEYGMTKEVMKTTIMTTLASDLIKNESKYLSTGIGEYWITDSYRFPIPPRIHDERNFNDFFPCFAFEPMLAQYISVETGPAMWASLFEYLDDEINSRLKKQFALKLTLEDDLVTIKNRITSLFVNYRTSSPTSMFGALGIAKHKHNEDAEKITIALKGCNTIFALQNVLYSALNDFEHRACKKKYGEQIYTSRFVFEKLTYRPLSHSIVPITDAKRQGIRKGFHCENSYYQSLLGSFDLVQQFIRRSKLLDAVEEKSAELKP